MALTTTSPLTTYDSCDAISTWSGVDGIDTDEKIEGTGCLASDVDIETDVMLGPTITSINMSATKYAIYPWMANYTAAYLDTKAGHGLFVALSDGTNTSYWDVGGTDTYSGGWEVLPANTDAAPDWNSGTAADLTAITNFGFGFKGVSKSKLADNSFLDYFRYATAATAALKVTGTNTTTDEGWAEILTDDQTLIAGIIKSQPGGYLIKGTIQIGDDSGTLSTTFTDDGNIIVFGDYPVGDNHFGISCKGNTTGTTSVTLKNQVIKSDGGRFNFDQSDANLDTFSITGSTLVHSNSPTFKSGQTVTGNVFDDSLQIKSGAATFTGNIIKGYVGTGGGALLFTSDNTSSNSFISSGSGHAIYITSTGTYDFTDMLFTGYGATGTTDAIIYNNSGGLVTINKSGGTALTYRNGAGASTVINSSVPIQVTVLNKNTKAAIQYARVHLILTSDYSTVVMSAETNASGIASTSWSGATGVGLTGWAREMNLTSPDYHPADLSGTIDATAGYVTQVELIPI